MHFDIKEPVKPQFNLTKPEKIIKIDEDTGYLDEEFEYIKIEFILNQLKNKYDISKLYLCTVEDIRIDRDNREYVHHVDYQIRFVDEVENVDYDNQIEVYEKALKKYNDALEKYKEDIKIYNNKLVKIKNIIND